MEKTRLSIERFGQKTVILAAVWLSGAFAGQLAPAQSTANRQTVSQTVAQKWIAIGREQYNRGLYNQAEQSLQYAQDYHRYLTAGEQKQLKGLLARVRSAAAQRQRIGADIKAADELIVQGRLLQAKKTLKKIERSKSLSNKQRQDIRKGIEKINHKLKEQEKEIAKLYERTMKFYRRGEFERARQCLGQIDAILGKTARPSASVEEAAEGASGPAAEITYQRKVKKAVLTEAVVTAPQPNDSDTLAAVEPWTDEPEQTEDPAIRKEKIVRSYTRAVVSDAIAKTQLHAAAGNLDEAQKVIEAAKQIVDQNRQYLGQDIFRQYKRRLERLAETILGKEK